MKKLFFILLILFSGVTVFADNVNFRISAPNTVVAGQQFRVEFVVNADGRDFRVGDFPGLEVLMGPSTSSSMSTQIINGKVSSETSKTFTYIVVAPSEGQYRIPAATVKVDGRQYSTNAFTLKALPADKASTSHNNGNDFSDEPSRESTASVGANDVMVHLSLSKTKAYENEAIVATVKLLTTNGQTQLQDAKFPNFEGFTVQEIELPDQKSYELEHYNGRNYYTVVLKQYLLYPQRAGKIDVGAATLDVVVPVRTQRKMRSIFDDFFDDYQNVNKKISSGKHVVTVEALPAGKPASFMSAVGHFNVTSSISSTNVKANNAITLKLTISGNGNLKYIKDPELQLPSDFETYDPKVDLKMKATTAGVSGTKTIEYTIIPRFPGDFEIPGIAFSYFDLNTKSYKTITTESYKLHVDKGDASSANASNYSTVDQESVKLLGNDIRFIKTGNLNLHRQESVLFGSLFFYLSYLIPLLLFAVLFIVYRKQVKENANIALMKTKKANKVALKRLKSASKYLQQHQKDNFYDEMLKAVWGYLSDKLSIPTSELTRDNVESILKDRGVDESLITSFMHIVSTCEFARYAPSQSDAAMDDLYAETVEAIGKMENAIRK